MAGIPVHIITVNDYLAQRDAEWMGPIYKALGLRVGAITHDMSPEDRRRAYRCDVTYCTNKEIVFDYLRDRLELGRKPGHIRMRLERMYKHGARIDRLRLRGLCFGIVDEADSVLIDEARTPLIISGAKGDNTDEEPRSIAQALVVSARARLGTSTTPSIFREREVKLLTGPGASGDCEELGRTPGRGISERALDAGRSSCPPGAHRAVTCFTVIKHYRGQGATRCRSSTSTPAGSCPDAPGRAGCTS